MPKDVIQTHAYTGTYQVISNRLISETEIIYNECSESVNALWDTGSTITCVSEELAKKLSMISTGKTIINTPNGVKEKDTYLVDIILPNKVKLKEIVVCETEIGNQGIDVIIGMDIINLGDFAVSNFENRTVFTFRFPSMGTTDYVKQIALKNTIGKKGVGAPAPRHKR